MAENRYKSADHVFTDPGLLSANNFIFTQVRRTGSFPPTGTSFVFDGLALVICLDGHGEVNVNYKTFDIHKDQILLIMPSQIITLPGGEDACVATIFIGNDYLSFAPMSGVDFDTLVQIGKYPILTLTHEEMEHLMELHKVILTRYQKINNPYNELCIGALMFSFLAEISSIYEKNKPATLFFKPTRQKKITEDFFKLLLDNYHSERSVGFYADKLCFSVKYISRVVKKVTGHTIQEWIIKIVIIHIKNLLKTTDKTILEISEEMNFSNSSFFGRFFKQYVGMTPQQFRLRG